MQRERSRPWTVPETAVFRSELARADRRVHTELVSEDRRLAVQRDTERAAAWSEPVRRIAQPRRRAPGVDYHRLSPDEHAWIFDELIAPSYLNRIVPRNDPRAVYVLGRPGAGKLLAARMVRRAMRPGTTRLVGDDFKASHPDYYQLLRDDPRSAGAAIRADCKAWFAQAEEYVHLRRGDVLIEAAPGSTEEFLDSALPFATTGYPVELVVLAVREADSRLATALRYARTLQCAGTRLCRCSAPATSCSDCSSRLERTSGRNARTTMPRTSKNDRHPSLCSSTSSEAAVTGVEQHDRADALLGGLDDGCRPADTDLRGGDAHALGEGVHAGDALDRCEQHLHGLLGGVVHLFAVRTSIT